MVGQKISLEELLAKRPVEETHSGCGNCGSGQAAGQCGNGLEKIYPTTAVRFGYMRYIGEFTHNPDMKFSCGAKVVIQTRRGIELGEQVSLTCTGCDKSVTREQMKEWVASCGEDSFIFEAGRILREATAADFAEIARIRSTIPGKKAVCRRVATEQKLAIRVVDIECMFGGERIICYFTAEERIDFRSLVKELADEYRTRIEMRQIGARDEARLLADYETCGREVCCKVFLKTLRPISMRMAKVQKSTLDPSQVSGRCGRLKCCLRYEHVGYEALDKLLPRKGIRIRTNHGEGVIINRQILTQLVQIRLDDGTVSTIVSEDITEVNVPPPSKVEPVAKEDVRTTRRPTPGRRPAPPRGRERPKGDRPVARPAKPKPSRPSKPPATTENTGDSSPVAGNDKSSENTDATKKRPRRRRRRGRKPPNSGQGGDGPTKPPPTGD